MKSPFKNAKGSVIKRGGKIAGYNYPIGKVIGGKVYMHIDYMKSLPNPSEAQNALNAAKNSHIRCVSYDPKGPVYMFSESPDFDTANEPIPGKAIKVIVTKNGFDVKAPKTIKQIWHHKWQWVDDNYRGFNVDKSYKWSIKWATKISNPSGSRPVWQKQLESVGLGQYINEVKSIYNAYLNSI